MKQTKIFCGQLNCLVKLADVSNRCSSLVILRAKDFGFGFGFGFALRMTRLEHLVKTSASFTKQLSCPQESSFSSRLILFQHIIMAIFTGM